MRSPSILILIFICTGCGHVQPSPELVQYGVHADLNPPGFYGSNNKTHEHIFKSFTDPAMKAAQCLSVEDYKKSEKWVAELKLQAEKCGN